MNDSKFQTLATIFVCEKIWSGSGNIHCLAPNDYTALDCMETIIQDPSKTKVFYDTFGFKPELAKLMIPRLTGGRMLDYAIQMYRNGSRDPSDHMICADSIQTFNEWLESNPDLND